MLDIIIPAYNCKDTLPRTLGSIVAQTKKEKCIVTIVDDCSTEDLKPIIEDFKKYIKINYIKLKENLTNAEYRIKSGQATMDVEREVEYAILQ